MKVRNSDKRTDKALPYVPVPRAAEDLHTTKTDAG